MRQPLLKFRYGHKFGDRMFYGRHKGQDYSPLKRGSKVPAVAIDHGQIVRAGYTPLCGKGVDLKTNKGYKARYCHLSHIDVKKGQRVKWGEKVGLIGSTGLSRGIHLHLAMWGKTGKLIDPLSVIGIKIIESLVSKINLYFRQIFERTPTKDENDYYRRRIIGQKEPTLDTVNKLLDTMKYYRSRGKVIGK